MVYVDETVDSVQGKVFGLESTTRHVGPPIRMV
jgi:hypothetical protein